MQTDTDLLIAEAINFTEGDPPRLLTMEDCRALVAAAQSATPKSINDEQIDELIRKFFGHRVLDPAPGVMDDLRVLVVEAISFGYLQTVDQLAVPEFDPAIQRERATADAKARGMAWLVDGMHVSADRIETIYIDDGTGPLAELRQLKREAKELLAQINEATKTADKNSKLTQQIAFTLSVDTSPLKEVLELLRGAYKALESPNSFGAMGARFAIFKFLQELPSSPSAGRD